MGFFYFIIMIGALVFFHELGHFLVAKAFDVKVERFSIGFGPKLFGFWYGETEYVICALPLGGYVQMLGGDFADAETIAEEDKDRALLAKPIWQRSLIVLAGPVFNLILPVIVFFFFSLTQSTMAPSVVGEVLADTPAAAAGLEPGDVIVEIDGDEVDYWHEIIAHVTPRPEEKIPFAWERDGKRYEGTITPALRVENEDALGVLQTTRGQIGILLTTHGPTIAISGPSQPAAKAGLKNFDRIVQINGQPVKRLDEILSTVRQSEGKPLEIVALRPQKLGAEFGDFYKQDPVKVTVQPVQATNDEGKQEWSVGFVRAEMVLSEVEPGSAADKAGLQPGDYITKLNGKPQNSWMILLRTIHLAINDALVARDPDDKSTPSVSFEVEYIRDGVVKTTTVTPVVTKYQDEYQQDRYRRDTGWRTIFDTVEPDPIDFPFFSRMGYGVSLGAEKTWEGVSMIGRLFARIFEGKVSFSKQVGGPILMGELAARAGEAGAASFLWTMALLSINLGVFNLLPIPLLDGGRLMLFAVEAVKRGPLSFRTRQITAYIGFVLIIMLMLLAFKNDIERNWDYIVDFLF
jgi:regulator of sigma E protease